MTLKRTLFAFVTALSVCAADSPKAVSPEASVRLKAITARFEHMVEQGQISGAVLLVAHHNQVVLLDAVGFQNIEKKTPMRTDSIFQILSQTKSFTSVGVMLLVDEGRVLLTDPVEKYLPEFRGLQVADGGKLRKPKRPMAVWDLLAHTSGMAHDGAPELSNLLVTMDRSLAEAVTIQAKLPLTRDPGSEWAYCNENTAAAGRIIEVVSGRPYDQFIKARILDPLGMKDSFYFPDAASKPRIAMLYHSVKGKLERSGPEVTGGDPARYREGAIYPGPEFGLYSTASDMAAFHLMMLNGGTWQGQRIVSRSAVDVMTAVHTSDLPTKYPGSGWGLGWHIIRSPAGMLTMLSLGAYGHGGGFGTYSFVDRSKDLVGVMMIQSSGTPVDVRCVFTTMVNAAIDRETQ